MSQMEKDLKAIESSARRLVSLFDDPQPGLSAWTLMVVDRCKEISTIIRRAERKEN